MTKPNFDVQPLPDRGRRISPKPHLPDCASLNITKPKACDCGRPNHPLPANRELYRDNKGRIRTRKRRASTPFEERDQI